MTYDEQHSVYLARCEEALSGIVKRFFLPLSRVAEAAEYSLLNGGKRVRGVLVLAACDLLEGDFRAADTFAGAMEMIHSFSLIHDDLPCMDDDDMRRGKPSNHIVFGEATALLAGDMLAIQAFEAIASSPHPAEMRVGAASVLSSAAGGRGMIFGQELDLKYEEEKADEAALYQIHRSKTGALISASVTLGILAASQEPEEHAELKTYAEHIGLAFQIVDDILDHTSTSEVLGKPVGSDTQQGKTTFVTMYGLDKSRNEVDRLTREAIEGIRQRYAERAFFLEQFASQLAARIR